MEKDRDEIGRAAFAMLNGFLKQRGCDDMLNESDRKVAFEAAIVLMVNIITWLGGDLALVQVAADKIREGITAPMAGEWIVYSRGKQPRVYPGPDPTNRK
jgi:hypothetical protein